jgi:hypothetical protein
MTSKMHVRGNRAVICAALAVATLAVFLGAMTTSVKASWASFSNILWITGDTSNIVSLDNYDSLAATQAFDNLNTVMDPVFAPSNWNSGNYGHFIQLTAYSSCTNIPASRGTGCQANCKSLTDDIADGSLSNYKYVMYDPESWCYTPPAEQTDPWDAMKSFAQTAHNNGFTVIMAPAVDLFDSMSDSGCTNAANPSECKYLAITGGTENLTVAQEAGKYADWYTIQSQNQQFENTNGAPAQFENMVSKASSDAYGENSSVIVTEGINASPVSGTITAPDLVNFMLDTRDMVSGAWANITRNRLDLDVQYLELLQDEPVWYLTSGSAMTEVSPSSSSGGLSVSLMNSGSTTWTIPNYQAYPAGTVIPAGTYTLNYYTDGTNSTSATVNIEVGYCTAHSCSSTRVPITSGWSQSVVGGLNTTSAPGAVSQFTTTTATTLPSGGPYDIYMTVTVVNPAGSTLDLLYNTGPTGPGDSSMTTPANLAIPVPVVTPSLVQAGSFTNGVTGSPNTLTLSLPSPSLNGDRLVATIAGGSGLTISAPNGWRRSVEADNGTNHAEIWYYYNCPPNVPSTTLTFTYTGANEARGAVSEFAGLSTKDVTGSSSTGSGTSSIVSTSGATSGTNDLAITAFTEHLNASGTVTMTPGSGWINLANNDGTSAADHQTFDYIFGASGTVSETETSNVSGASWQGVIATFKP